MTTLEEVQQALDDAHRREWAVVLSATVRVAGDLDLGEECAQDAYVRALEVWTRDGIPRNPAAWLTTTAQHLALDRHRRAAVLRAKVPMLVEPAAHELPERLDAVLTVLNLVLTTGHTAPTGAPLRRGDLMDRALDLTRTLLELMPDEREMRALLAIGVFAEARAATRVAADGSFVPLEDQDRGAWDRELIDEGDRLVRAALRGGRPGRFALQAAIASLHTGAPTFAAIDWCEVVALYDLLHCAWPTPVVALNRAIALGFRDGFEAGLAELDHLDSEGTALARYHYLPAARADLLRRLRRTDEAAAAYRLALGLVDNETERAFLRRGLQEVSPSQPGSGPTPG